MIKRFNLMKSNQGAAMIWALILFTIITILLTSMIFIARQDILETTIHEERLRTFYIALSGVDIGYAALMALDGTEQYIEQFITDEDKTVTDIIDITINAQKMGEASVTLDSVTVDGKRWIRVLSVGQLVDGTQTVTSIMRINPDNTQHTIREGFTP